jgi:hypothetical protein
MESQASIPTPAQDFYVVSDRNGFVGAFLTREAAVAVGRQYPTLQFIAQKYPLEPGLQTHVWLVLYQANDLVAFASNSHEKALQVQETFGSIGAAHEDDLDYWKQPFGSIPESVKSRLDSEHRAHVMYAGPLAEEAYRKLEEADAKRVEKFMGVEAEGPLERAIRENERMSILDHVVAVKLSEASAEVPAEVPVEAPVDTPAV